MIDKECIILIITWLSFFMYNRMDANIWPNIYDLMFLAMIKIKENCGCYFSIFNWENEWLVKLGVLLLMCCWGSYKWGDMQAKFFIGQNVSVFK